MSVAQWLLISFFFGNSVFGRFKKGIPSFDKIPFDVFLFYEQLNRERYTYNSFDSFFLMKAAPIPGKQRNIAIV